MGRIPSRPPPELLGAYLSGGFGLGLSSMIALLVPLRADEMGASLAMIGLIVAARPTCEVLASVRVGSTIDRLGPGRSFVLGTALCALSSIGMAMTGSAWLLLALQLPLGAGRSLAWVGSQTAVSGLRLGTEQAKDTARFAFVSNVSQIVGPALIGSLAVLVGYRLSFVAITIYATGFAILGTQLPSDRPSTAPHGDERPRHGWRDAVGLLRVPGIRMAMLLTFVRLWTSSVWRPFFPLLLVMSGGSAAFGGVVVSSSAVVATMANLLVGHLSRWASPATWCIAGLGLSVVGVAIAPFSTESPGAFLSAGLIGVGQGLSLPLLIVLVSQSVRREQRGLALASRGGINSAASSLAPLILAPLITALGMATGFVVAAGFAGLILVGALQLRPRLERPIAAPEAAPGS